MKVGEWAGGDVGYSQPSGRSRSTSGWTKMCAFSQKPNHTQVEMNDQEPSTIISEGGVENWNFPPCREDNYCFLHQMRARDDGRSIRLLGIPRPGGEVEDRSSCFFSCKRFFNIESVSPARVSRASTPRGTRSQPTRVSVGLRARASPAING